MQTRSDPPVTLESVAAAKHVAFLERRAVERESGGEIRIEDDGTVRLTKKNADHVIARPA